MFSCLTRVPYSIKDQRKFMRHFETFKVISKNERFEISLEESEYYLLVRQRDKARSLGQNLSCHLRE